MTRPARPNGCYDRKDFKPSLLVQDGWYLDGVTRVARVVSIPFRMAPECQYQHTELGKSDERCAGCSCRDSSLMDGVTTG